MLNGILGINPLFTNTNLTLNAQVLGTSPNACDSTADTVTATTINATTVNSTNNVSNIYSITPGVAKGISIGGNSITGLGTGVVANAVAAGSLAIGDGSLTDATATNSTALGTGANIGVGGVGGVAVGNGASAAGAGAIAIGAQSAVTTAGGVAIGQGSVDKAATPTAGATIGGTAYTFAGAAPTSVVSIGSAATPRQLANVAAGQLSATSTDGVNGSQLFATNTQVGVNTTAITNITAGTAGSVQRTAAPNDLTLTATGGTGAAPGAAQRLSNVAQGTVGTDAVNLSQLNASNANAVQYDAVGGVRQNSATLVGGAPGTVTLANVGNGSISPTSTQAINGSQLFTTNNNVATNTNAIASINNGTSGLVLQAGGAPGIGAITIGAATGGPSISVAGTGGNRTLTGVAPGSLLAGSVDAVDGGQFNTLGTATATNLGGGAAFNPVTGTVTAPSYTVQGTAYNNVGSALGAVDGSLTNITNGTTGILQRTGAATNAAVLTATGGTAATPGAAQTLGNVAAGVAVTDAVNVGQLNAVGATAANSVQYDTVAGVKTNSVTLAGGVPGPVTVTNVAPGALTALSTDAVNGSQLNATNTNVTANTTAIINLGNGTSGLVQQTGGAPGVGQITVGAATGGTSVSFAGLGGVNRALTGVAPGSLAAGSVDAVNGGQVNTLGTALAGNLGGGATFDPATGTVTAPSYAVGGTAYNNVGGAVAALQAGAPLQYATAGAPTTPNGLVPSQNVTLVGAAAGPVTLDNIAPGATTAGSTQAVDGGQLNTGLTSLATNLGGGAAYDPASGTVTAPSYTIGGTAYGNVGTAFGAVDASLTNINSGTTGILQRTGPATNVTVLTATGGTAAAPGAAQVVTNVAPGAVTAASTDAINGSQLFATNTGVGGIAGVLGGTYDPATGAYAAPTYTVANGATATTVQGAFNSYNTAITGLSNGTVGLVQQVGPAAPITVGAATGGTVVNIAGTAGTRTLTGLTGGINATDAVTVAQINNLTGGQLNAVQYDTLPNGDRANLITLTGGAAGPVRITGVAPGSLAAGSTDAVNGGQVNTLGTGLAAGLGGGAAFNPATGTVSAPAYAVGGATYGNVGAAVAALQTGSPVQYATAAAPTTANGLVPSQNVTLVGAAAGPVTLGNVAAGSTAAGSTQAINGGQFNAGLGSVATSLGGGATYNPTTGTITAPAYTVQGATYNSTGAAIGAVDTSLTNLQNGLNNGTVGLVQQAGGATAPITVGGSTGGTVVNIAGTAGPRTLSGVAAGTAPTDAANVAQVNAVGSVAANSVQYDTVGGVKTNSVTLAGGTAGPVKVTNVAAGALTAGSTDAVNGDQLAATNTQVASNTANIITNTNSINSILTGQVGGFRSDNSAGAAVPVASGANSTAGGYGSSATALRSVAIGNGASSTGTNSVALGAGSSDGGVANVVSVGSVGGERRITNVGPAVSGTDAVNLAQLQGATTQFQTGLAGVQQSIAGVQFDLNRFKKKANAGTAGAMAVAGLPQAFTPGAGLIAASVGTWQDQVGFAFGASKIIGDQTIIKAGASFTTRGSGGGTVGVGVQF